MQILSSFTIAISFMDLDVMLFYPENNIMFHINCLHAVLNNDLIKHELCKPLIFFTGILAHS